MSNNSKKAYLVLADGTVFNGYSMGAEGSTIGEVVFNTCMSSYQQLLSDPTYYGQIVAQTYPLVGNRGVEGSEENSEIMANGYIAREWCDTPTDIGGGVTLDEYLKKRGIVGICGIDTRKLTRTLRNQAYVNCAITDNIDDMDRLLYEIKKYTISGAVEAITIKEPETYKAENGKYKVVVIDYGFPRNMIKSLTKRGCEVVVVPATYTPEQIMEYKPDGIVFSDGPGDPDDNAQIVKNLTELLNSDVHCFGIGLGHQMMGLAVGGKIDKMLSGHRGSTQPVKILDTKRIVVTTQNHGYAVNLNGIDEKLAKVTMINVNDGSVEGIEYSNGKSISVQFTPADNGTTFDETSWIYDDFISLMNGEKSNA
ncbi:MAG: carbamoyl phosphate synthase small subunit [Clostridiales bacterium]|nr:carbamoyl phosphate synthase small subunit [Clostridiales bacterium]